MDQPKNQFIEKLKASNNILVTVSSNPSVDQLAAAIGLTLALNAAGKHGTAVYSGKTPSTIEFLQPDSTIRKDTNSLRDFIISLDKEKADKLRYKVEDKMVKIFITPYKTSLSSADLEFTEGDFNVDMVVALGVREKDELDEAITSHGRILHDATVATLNIATSGQMGSINWVDADSSSLCEMLVSVVQQIKEDVIDKQMATAFLTGIVAETERFSNDKTSSNTMKSSAQLMAAGADQQLVATKLQEPLVADEPIQEPSDEADQELQESARTKEEDGVLKVSRSEAVNTSPDDSTGEDVKSKPPIFDEELPGVFDENNEDQNEEQLHNDESEEQEDANESRGSQYLTDEPDNPNPITGSHMDADNTPNATEVSPKSDAQILNRSERTIGPVSEDQNNNETDQPQAVDEPSRALNQDDYDKVMSAPVPDEQTISSLEQAVASPHVSAGAVWPDKPKADAEEPVQPTSQPADAQLDKDSARAAIDEAMKQQDQAQEAATDKEGGMDIAHEEANVDHSLQIDPSTGQMQYTKDVSIDHADQPPAPVQQPERPQVQPAPDASIPENSNSDQSSIAPPPVPPPMMPPAMPQPSNNAGQQLPPINH